MTWDTFFGAEVGASAALAGLIFVGISINLQRIIALPSIANRALQSLLMLLGVLTIDSVLLVPGEAGAAVGVEVLLVTLLLWLGLDWIESRSWAEIEPSRKKTFLLHSVEIQIPWVFATVGGAFLLLGDGSALYWIVPATIATFVITIVESWIILVEINR
jgi:modulator of FtsH protease